MNCRSFQNQLYEYVEGSLPAGAQAVADQHLAGCAACRAAVRREKQLGQVMSGRLRQTAETLTLSQEIKNRLLIRSQDQAAPPTLVESIANLWNRHVRLAAIPACLLLICVLLLAGLAGFRRFHAGPASPAARNQPAAVSIQISYRMPRCTFRREGNMVVDSLSDDTVVASGIFHPGGEAVPAQQERKTTL